MLLYICYFRMLAIVVENLHCLFLCMILRKMWTLNLDANVLFRSVILCILYISHIVELVSDQTWSIYYHHTVNIFLLTEHQGIKHRRVQSKYYRRNY